MKQTLRLATWLGCLIGMLVLCHWRLAAQTLSLPHERFVLPNGLNVILHEDLSLPVVTVNVWYHVGSGSEKAGRTGFAHLFEHIMFEGSKNVPEGDFDNWLEKVGGNNNGSTNADRTNYYEEIPSNALPLALFLESDRLGFLLPTLTQQKLDGQRDVVKNERRQSYDNQPYGLAYETLLKMMYPASHPYSWSTIGSMADLSAASLQDVVDFFKTYYVPANASLVVAGDINMADARKQVEHWFSDVPASAPVMRPAAQRPILTEVKYETLEDKVQLPRLYMAWHSPANYTPGDAELDLISEVLAGGRSSRLYQKLVNELQLAQSVNASQSSQNLSSNFSIVVTAAPGVALNKIVEVVDAELEKLRNEPPTARELVRAQNQYESGLLSRLENVGNKADLLNTYYYYTGNADYLNEDINRYRAVSTTDLRSMAARYLTSGARVMLSIVPKGKTDLAATPKP